jgi:hypothetical protein
VSGYAPNPCSKVTRREALALGAAVGVTATVGDAGVALATTTMGGLTGSGPEYLQRSGYRERIGERFFAGGHALTLVSVDDVAGAQFNERLRGHEAAFSLRFSGPADALPSSLYEVSNDMLGPFPLFLGPDGPAHGTEQDYNAVIDRSVRVRIGSAPTGAGPQPQAVPQPEPAKDAGRRDDEPASEPTVRDLEIADERERAVQAERLRRRRRVRRARRRLRGAHANRMNFVRRQRKAARNIRRRWLARHLP